MQRLPGDYSVLNNRLERPAPNDSVEGDEIVRSIRKRVGTVNPLVPGSSPGGPTTFPGRFRESNTLSYSNQGAPTHELLPVLLLAWHWAAERGMLLNYRSPPIACAKLLAMFVRHYGNAGPLVLVLHGGPAAVGDVAPVAKGISGSFHAVEPWQRGSGGSPLTVARHITDLHELATDLGGDSRVAIVGHSWGAMLALCYAANYPSKAGPIVLVGCGTFDQASRSTMQATIEERMDDEVRDRIRRVSADATDPADQFIQTFKLTRHIFDCDPIGPYADKEECEPFDLRAYDETWRDMRRLQDDGTYPRAFAAIESPVLMIHGQYDPHPGKMIRDSLLPHLPQLEYRELESCGHNPWIEKSARELFFSIVCEWLEGQTS